ncbi:unnamed protein product [Anisakis simplex]|uniref:Uncharacterized protein n=1 Tax=Anisakis simplex TaxID=6269 RepID=A0A0M3KI39_ANISI|nr:unnamed protein product [Anisakis simplex]
MRMTKRETRTRTNPFTGSHRSRRVSRMLSKMYLIIYSNSI